MKSIFTTTLLLFTISAFAQYTFTIGGKSYTSSEAIKMTSNSDYDYDLDLFFAIDGNHGYVVLRKQCVNKEQFVREIILALDNGKVVMCPNSEISVREDKDAKALYYLTTEHINTLRASNIRSVQYWTNNYGKVEVGTASNKENDIVAIAHTFFGEVKLIDIYNTEQEPSDDEPLQYVEQMPVFPDGQQAMYKYIYDSIKYPANAREKGISGQVIAQFIVQADGEITDAVITRGISGGCDEEVLRIVNNMPDWIPARHNGKNVAVYFTLPIKFVLSK